MGQERLDLGGEQEGLVVAPEMKRLDAETIARQEDLIASAVVDGQCPHPVEPVQAVDTPLLVGGKNHLGVGVRDKAVTERLQFDSQLQVVVYLAVEHDPLIPARGCHRLVSHRGQVDDRQASVPQANRPPMGIGIGDPAPRGAQRGDIEGLGGGVAPAEWCAWMGALPKEDESIAVRSAVFEKVSHPRER